MNRNKYIYASSYGAFVVESDYRKGGTWAGATEAIKNGWTNVYVWENKDHEGNIGLIEQGAIPYRLSDETLVDILSGKKTTSTVESQEKTESYEQLSLFNKNSDD